MNKIIKIDIESLSAKLAFLRALDETRDLYGNEENVWEKNDKGVMKLKDEFSESYNRFYQFYNDQILRCDIIYQ